LKIIIPDFSFPFVFLRAKSRKEEGTGVIEEIINFTNFNIHIM